MIGRGIMFSGPGEVSIDCFEVPSPGDGEILIETIYSGISLGTERAHLRAEPNTLTHGGYFPFRPGYSNVGRIIKVGAAISRFHIGQLVVTTLPHVSHATLGVSNELGTFPSPASTSSTDVRTLAPPSLVWPLADDLDENGLKASSTFMWLRVALAGIRRSRLEIGERVLVLGLGPIGLLAVQFARLAGAIDIHGVDINPVRREVAKANGANSVYGNEAQATEACEKLGFPDVVIDATGRPEVTTSAFRLCRPGGRVVLLGSNRGKSEGVDFYRDVHLKGLTVLGVHELTRPLAASVPGNWTGWDDGNVVLRLIEEGRLDFSRVITHQFDTADAALAYDTLNTDPAAISAIFKWQ